MPTFRTKIRKVIGDGIVADAVNIGTDNDSSNVSADLLALTNRLLTLEETDFGITDEQLALVMRNSDLLHDMTKNVSNVDTAIIDNTQIAFALVDATATTTPTASQFTTSFIAGGDKQMWARIANTLVDADGFNIGRFHFYIYDSTETGDTLAARIATGQKYDGDNFHLQSKGGTYSYYRLGGAADSFSNVRIFGSTAAQQRKGILRSDLAISTSYAGALLNLIEQINNSNGVIDWERLQVNPSSFHADNVLSARQLQLLGLIETYEQPEREGETASLYDAENNDIGVILAGEDFTIGSNVPVRVGIFSSQYRKGGFVIEINGVDTPFTDIDRTEGDVFLQRITVKTGDKIRIYRDYSKTILLLDHKLDAINTDIAHLQELDTPVTRLIADKGKLTTGNTDTLVRSTLAEDLALVIKDNALLPITHGDIFSQIVYTGNADKSLWAFRSIGYIDNLPVLTGTVGAAVESLIKVKNGTVEALVKTAAFSGLRDFNRILEDRHNNPVIALNVYDYDSDGHPHPSSQIASFTVNLPTTAMDVTFNVREVSRGDGADRGDTAVVLSIGGDSTATWTKTYTSGEHTFTANLRAVPATATQPAQVECFTTVDAQPSDLGEGARQYGFDFTASWIESRQVETAATETYHVIGAVNVIDTSFNTAIYIENIGGNLWIRSDIRHINTGIPFSTVSNWRFGNISYGNYANGVTITSDNVTSAGLGRIKGHALETYIGLLEAESAAKRIINFGDNVDIDPINLPAVAPTTGGGDVNGTPDFVYYDAIREKDTALSSADRTIPSATVANYDTINITWSLQSIIQSSGAIVDSDNRSFTYHVEDQRFVGGTERDHTKGKAEVTASFNTDGDITLNPRTGEVPGYISSIILIAGVRGAKGDPGEDGAPGAGGGKGDPGEDGDNGWSPVLTNVERTAEQGGGVVQRITDWTGGSGDNKPATGSYISGSTLTTNIAQATNIKGSDGEDGLPGAPGARGISGEGIPIDATIARFVNTDSTPETFTTTANTEANLSISLNYVDPEIEGLSYNSTTKEITLPIGNWDVRGYMTVANRSSSTTTGTARLYGDITMVVNDGVVANSSIYVRQNDNTESGIPASSVGEAFVTSIIDSDGSTRVKLELAGTTQTSGTVEVSNVRFIVASFGGVRGGDGAAGEDGAIGNDGWSPVLANVERTELQGGGVVQQVSSWQGGSGTAPASGSYIRGSGFTDDITTATNIKGSDGEQGETGADGTGGGTSITETEAIRYYTSSVEVPTQIPILTPLGEVFQKNANTLLYLGAATFVSTTRSVADGTEFSFTGYSQASIRDTAGILSRGFFADVSPIGSIMTSNFLDRTYNSMSFILDYLIWDKNAALGVESFVISIRPNEEAEIEAVIPELTLRLTGGTDVTDLDLDEARLGAGNLERWSFNATDNPTDFTKLQTFFNARITDSESVNIEIIQGQPASTTVSSARLNTGTWTDLPTQSPGQSLYATVGSRDGEGNYSKFSSPIELNKPQIAKQPLTIYNSDTDKDSQIITDAQMAGYNKIEAVWNGNIETGNLDGTDTSFRIDPITRDPLLPTSKRYTNGSAGIEITRQVGTGYTITGLGILQVVLTL